MPQAMEQQHQWPSEQPPRIQRGMVLGQVNGPTAAKKWLWVCHTCPKREGWLDTNQWANLGYPGPISRVHYPASGNIDQCGPEVCDTLPGPWCINGFNWESCGPECEAPTTPWDGKLWPGKRPSSENEDSDSDSAVGINQGSAESGTSQHTV